MPMPLSQPLSLDLSLSHAGISLCLLTGDLELLSTVVHTQVIAVDRRSHTGRRRRPSFKHRCSPSFTSRIVATRRRRPPPLLAVVVVHTQVLDHRRCSPLLVVATHHRRPCYYSCNRFQFLFLVPDLLIDLLKSILVPVFCFLFDNRLCS